MAFFTRRQAPQPVSPEEHIYLIDTENVKSVWTMLLERMTNQDKVYVFYTMNSGSVSYEAITGILQYGKRIELVECFTGKNGLDFQLVSYLGYMIRDNEKADYCIVSDDGGYDAAVKFWEKKGIKISRKTASEVSGKPAKTSRGRGLKGLKVTARTKKRDPEEKKEVLKTTETAKAEPRKAEPRKAEPVKAEAGKQEPKKQEPKKQEPKKQGPKKQEAKKQEAKKPEAPKAEIAPVKVQLPAEKKEPVKVEVPQMAMPMVEVAEPQDVAELVLPNQNPAAKKAEKKPAKKAQVLPENRSDEKPQTKPAAKAEKPVAKKEKPAVKAEKPVDKAEKAVPKYRVSEEKLRELLAGETPEHVEEILKVVKKAGRPDNLAEIHDGIEKIYRDENSQKVYRALRPHVKELFEQA